MPRLLLVDDNQSIHKIAETLLAATDIKLTCASSAAEALEKVESDGPFDVALLDTSMQGTDGWTLLGELRHREATARLPIAMMAGVLDTVDPEAVEKAPIQGFLKKPVELRDLAERVRNLMAMEVALPEPVPAPVDEAPALAAEFATLPNLKPADHAFPPSDLLLLEPGDLFMEEEAAPAAGPVAAGLLEAPEASLELEELDLESLKGLGTLAQPLPEAPPEASAGPLPQEVPTREELTEIPDFAPEDDLSRLTPEETIVTDILPDLGPGLDLPSDLLPEEEPLPLDLLETPAPAPLPSDWSDESESLLPPAPPALEAAPSALGAHEDFGLDSFLEQEPVSRPTPPFLPEFPAAPTPDLEAAEAVNPGPDITTILPFEPESDLLEPDLGAGFAPAAALVPEPPGPAPEAFEAPVAVHPEAPAARETHPGLRAVEFLPAPPEAPPAPREAAPDLLAALLADPVLMDRLAKAVVAKLGDEALKEIAWEVMPELAERLQGN